jgi:tRNA 2-thiouridine synthesizing protein A
MDRAICPLYIALMDWHDDIDARGLLCPLPVLKLRKRLAARAGGEVVRITTTDPAAIVDIPHFCVEGGHRLLSSSEAEDAITWLVAKG